MSYRIITDSCCDFTDRQYETLSVSHADLTVLYRGEPREDLYGPGQLKEFYDAMRAGEAPTTAAANPQGWKNAMEPILAGGEDILCLAFSSGLSTTYQSAVIAADELREVYPQRKIHVVDTLAAALGQGLLVYVACKKRDEGLTLEALTTWVEENKLHVCHWFTVDDLVYLKRGGRVGAATALLGGMLNIKPVLHVDEEGHLINVSKVRGRRASLLAMANQVRETCTDFDMAFIGHGDCPEDARWLGDYLKEHCGIKNVTVGYVGAVIGAHTGPGVLALFFLGNRR